MEYDDLKQAVLAHVLNPNYRPVKPKTIAKALKLEAEEDVRGLKRAIKQLVKQGRVVYGANHLVGPATGAQGEKTRQGNQVTGVFRRTTGGFGFVRPVGALPDHQREQDIFIPAKSAADAATGDVVLVRLGASKIASRPNPVGEIVEVVERETHQFVGAYFESGGTGYVRVDGTLFSTPIAVGDPGAKSARVDDKVVFEMVRFPSHWHDGEGVITEVLGPRGTPGIDTLSIIREFGFPEHFAAETLDNARREAELFDESIPPGRLDLTAATVITIDPIDARDFDDAISLEPLENGHWRLGVHIADVTHFVKQGSPLDQEAHQRATSVYLPDRVIPMLPELISNGLASLQPDRVRYTKTAFIEFTAEGTFVAADLHTSAIKSQRRFTYEEVDQYLADPDGWREKLTPEVHALLARMRDLARILRRRRFQRGSLELSMAEVKVDLGSEGQVVGAHIVENTESHQIIEAFMLAANEAVAEYLAAAKAPFLRRVHMPPDPRKIKALNEFVQDLKLKVDSLEDRFELQRLLDKVRDLPESRAVNFAVLRSLQRAVYSPIEEGHYALASECYCHFTSPIRRYPDLTVHRLIDLLLNDQKPSFNMGELVVLGQHCSDLERRAEEAERDLTKVKLLSYLKDKIGEQMEAVVTGVEEFGLFAQGLKLPAEGLIHVSALADDYYYYERRTHCLTGRRAGNTFRLGDLIEVTIARVDVDRRELDFRLVQRVPRPPRVPKPEPDRPRPPSRDKPEKAAGGKKSGKKTGKKTRRKKR